jgi:hypothetical protein
LPLFLGDPLRNEAWQISEFDATFREKNDSGPVDKSDLIQIQDNGESFLFYRLPDCVQMPGLNSTAKLQYDSSLTIGKALDPKVYGSLESIRPHWPTLSRTTA